MTASDFGDLGNGFLALSQAMSGSVSETIVDIIRDDLLLLLGDESEIDISAVPATQTD